MFSEPRQVEVDEGVADEYVYMIDACFCDALAGVFDTPSALDRCHDPASQHDKPNLRACLTKSAQSTVATTAQSIRLVESTRP